MVSQLNAAAATLDCGSHSGAPRSSGSEAVMRRGGRITVKNEPQRGKRSAAEQKISYGVQKRGYGGMETRNKPENAGKGGRIPGQ